jgi:hypothetical protein
VIGRINRKFPTCQSSIGNFRLVDFGIASGLWIGIIPPTLMGVFMRPVYVPDAGLFEIMDPSYQIPVATGLLPMKSCVEDGDSVWFRGEEWRLMGYDAPETARKHGHGCPDEYGRGVAAAVRLSEMLCDAVTNGTLVWKLTRLHDRSKRRLVYAYIDGVNVADIMVSENHGHYFEGRGPKPPHCSCPGRERRHELDVHIAALKAEQKREVDRDRKALARAPLLKVAGIVVAE